MRTTAPARDLCFDRRARPASFIYLQCGCERVWESDLSRTSKAGCSLGREHLLALETLEVTFTALELDDAPGYPRDIKLPQLTLEERHDICGRGEL